MKLKLKSAILGAVAAGVLAMVPFTSANAGQCAAGDTCTFFLTETNQQGITSNIEVVVNNTASNTQITVNYLSSNLTNTALGIDQFGFNSALTTGTLPSGFSSQNCLPNGCQMDGFGRFISEIDSPGGTLLNFSFFLNGLETSFQENPETGAEFAVHVRFSGGCSFFAADAANPNPTAPDNCIIAQQAPEPGTLALLGISIAGIGYARSRAARR